MSRADADRGRESVSATPALSLSLNVRDAPDTRSVLLVRRQPACIDVLEPLAHAPTAIHSRRRGELSNSDGSRTQTGREAVGWGWAADAWAPSPVPLDNTM
ncbi:hypothetical protein GCM10019016_063390 [Streptomyces prasinosporus]|uniref:Uncharacterized protein n=1 Tax=Streptomyces prasinosporus TaxID=68256 RepID=A0ABP6TWV7_9ACTN|nr:hypothetical protein GCM10010332_66160 [Streptomyces albogriseolus]